MQVKQNGSLAHRNHIAVPGHPQTAENILARYKRGVLAAVPVPDRWPNPDLDYILQNRADYLLEFYSTHDYFILVSATNVISGLKFRYILSGFKDLVLSSSTKRQRAPEEIGMTDFVDYLFLQTKEILSLPPNQPSFEKILEHAPDCQMIISISDPSSAIISVINEGKAYQYVVSPCLLPHAYVARERQLQEQIWGIDNLDGMIKFLSSELKLDRVSMYKAPCREGRYYPDRVLDTRGGSAAPSLWNGSTPTDGSDDPLRKAMDSILRSRERKEEPIEVWPKETSADNMYAGQGSFIMTVVYNGTATVLLLEAKDTVTVEDLKRNGMARIITDAFQKLMRLEEAERGKREAQERAELAEASKRLAVRKMRSEIHNALSQFVPLGFVGLAIKEIDKQYQGDGAEIAKVKDFLTRAQSVQQGVNQLREFLNSAALDIDQPTIIKELKRLDLNVMVQRVMDEVVMAQVQKCIQQTDILVTFDVSPGAQVWITSVLEDLDLIIRNLLLNAINYGYSPTSGRILVSIVPKKIEVIEKTSLFRIDGISISIADSGLPLLGIDGSICEGELDPQKTYSSPTGSNTGESSRQGLKDVLEAVHGLEGRVEQTITRADDGTISGKTISVLLPRNYKKRTIEEMVSLQ